MNSLALSMSNITKRYPGVLALNRVHLELNKGEVHCLLGENGAGKSTLMKILAGAQPMDDGEILLDGIPTTIESPHHAQRLGIAMIHQEFSLLPHLSVAENIFLGREPAWRRTPFIDQRRMHQDAASLLARIDLAVDPARTVHSLSVAQQQMVEIAKALSLNARIIAMDEPSACLTDHELRALFNLIRSLKQEGIGIIYISHRLEEVFEIGDRITVMRDGEYVATRGVGEITRDDIIRMMVDRELSEEFPRHGATRGEERLRVESLKRDGAFSDVSFSLHRGEIVGLTGLVGSGRTEVARAIFGADTFTFGSVYLDSEVVHVQSPQKAIAAGIGLLTEDRKHQGLVLDMTVRENISLANLAALLRGPFIRSSRESKTADQFVEELRIKTPSVEQIVKNLSGGNQQKVVLARWLFTNARVLIFDEPTRGVDVGAKVEIYNLINRLVERGVAILLISSELPEILGMCDRVLVMCAGKIADELPRATATQAGIMRLATGQKS